MPLVPVIEAAVPVSEAAVPLVIVNQSNQILYSFFVQTGCRTSKALSIPTSVMIAKSFLARGMDGLS